MPVRIVEGQLPYTGGTGIEIDSNKVISLLLREENNLILVNDDNEIYTDLQLAGGILPTDDFPVGVTVGKVLQSDGWTQSGLILNWKTTSGDYARWIYANDGKIYFDNGTGTWNQVYYSSEVDTLLQQLRNYIDLNFQPKLTAGTGITIDANNVISAQGAGTGDVIGPDSSTDGDIALFDGATGKIIKDSGVSLSDYQEKLTAGTNITISSNTISATDTTYTAGTGLALNGTEFSNSGVTSFNGSTGDISYTAPVTSVNGSTGDVTVQETLVSGTNIKTINSTSLLGSGDISITDTTYTAGTGLSLVGTEFSADTTVLATQTDLSGKQDTLTAGTNITISSNTISATDTTYTAGTGLAIGTEHSDMQGPAPDGFHIPLTTEWEGLNTIMTSLSLTTGDNWRINLHLPFAGSRDLSDASIVGQGSFGTYWSSSPRGSDNIYYAYYLYLTSSSVIANNDCPRAGGNPVRCFRDSYVTPDSTWTVIQGTLGSAGIFRNQTDGIISITSDGITGYTIQDKNLGATTVYNNGDALTQANMGDMYQWGNNYGFPSTGAISNTSSTQVNASAYGPTNPYSSNTFITDEEDWSSVQNDNLWGGESQGTWVEGEGTTIINTGVTSVNGSTGAVSVTEFSPSNAGSTSQVLTKTADGYEWAAASGGDVVVSSEANNILTSGMKIWAGLETDYQNLGSRDSNTLYLTIDS